MQPDASESPLGRPIDWRPADPAARTELRGRYVVMRPLDAAADLEALEAASHDPAIWTYLPYGPFDTRDEFLAYLRWAESSDDPLFFTFCPLPDERPAGVASYLRVTPEHGVIEVGHIWLGTELQRSTAATEGIYLLAANVFDRLGYRRFEWKCNALNAASRRAAERLGFRFEGVFRNHMVVKGRNRDTAWFAITDDDWPCVRAAFAEWLEPDNFDRDGRQRKKLAARAANTA